MRIIDAHAHLEAAPGYLDGLLAAMDRHGIQKVCLSGLGPLFRMADNAAVEGAFRAHPDRVIGAYYLRPGVSRAAEVGEAHDRGFRMLKVTVPLAPYNDPAYEPLWAQAAVRNLPILFHTGIVATYAEGRGKGVSSWNMQPMQVEPITREFPELRVILAHLGVNWNTDAAEMARMRPNVYVDLTGAAEGWRRRADTAGMQTWLWWPDAFAKVVFGTDVHHTEIGPVLDEDRRRLDRLEVGPEICRRVFAGNILAMLGLEE